MTQRRQLHAFAYRLTLVCLVASTLLIARLRAPSFRPGTGSHATVKSTASHSKKQSLSYKSQFQPGIAEQVFRILPSATRLAEAFLADPVLAWLSPQLPFSNRPPPLN